jgi:hypothetical protein
VDVRRPCICVHCPNCDVVRVPAEVVTLRHCTDDGSWDYWLQCPECGQRSAGRSSWWLALEALAAGSPLEEWRRPDELNEQHHGPPLHLLDLAELHLALEQPDWIDALARNPSANEWRPPHS